VGYQVYDVIDVPTTETIGVVSVVNRLRSSREDVVDQEHYIINIDLSAVVCFTGIDNLRSFVEVEMVILSTSTQCCDAGRCLLKEIHHELRWMPIATRADALSAAGAYYRQEEEHPLPSSCDVYSV